MERKCSLKKSRRVVLFFTLLISFALVTGVRFFMLQKSPEAIWKIPAFSADIFCAAHVHSFSEIRF